MTPESFKNFLARRGLPHNVAVLNAFAFYAEKLIEYNKNVNLTAITDIEGIYLKHFADSVLGSGLIPPSGRVVDIGTGAGFPGIPLKLVRPDIEITLLDGMNKRVVFLKQLLAAPEINLNIPCFHSRAEHFGQKAAFDVAVARAVAKLPQLIKYAFPLLRHGGALLAYKSENIEEELAAAEKGAAKSDVKNITVYEENLNGDIKRKLVKITKL